MAPRPESFHLPWQNCLSQFLFISSYCCLTEASWSAINVSSPPRLSCVVENIQPGASDLQFSAAMPRLRHEHFSKSYFSHQEKEPENPGRLEGNLYDDQDDDHELTRNLTEHQAQEGFSNPELNQNPSPIDEKSDLVQPNKTGGSAFAKFKWRKAGRTVLIVNKIKNLNSSIIEKTDSIVLSTDKFLRSASQNRIIVWICKLVEELAEIQNSQSEHLLANIDIVRQH